MNRLFNPRAPAAGVDVQAINETIRRALASAGLDSSSGPMHQVTDTIERALGRVSPAVSADTIDVVARVVDGEAPQASASASASAPAAVGRFESHSFTHATGTRAYKVYAPPGLAPHAPVIVMLHGCTQSADDFAAGTRMNRLADRHGVLVIYPEQSAGANSSRCWNWFEPRDQQRDGGEPALLAALVRQVAARHEADLQRVYVAGLSAGAAMALILGETQPELVAAVGVHSGLPYGSAHDIPSALAAMKGGRGKTPMSVKPGVRAARPVPLIVFHGDRDHTVQHGNSHEIVRQASEAHRRSNDGGLTLTAETGRSAAGRAYGREVHADRDGRPVIESWTIHGGGHAWSGGDPAGSYTDAGGPDASAEMLRFFLAQPRG